MCCAVLANEVRQVSVPENQQLMGEIYDGSLSICQISRIDRELYRVSVLDSPHEVVTRQSFVTHFASDAWVDVELRI